MKGRVSFCPTIFIHLLCLHSCAVYGQKVEEIVLKPVFQFSGLTAAEEGRRLNKYGREEQGPKDKDFVFGLASNPSQFSPMTSGTKNITFSSTSAKT